MDSNHDTQIQNLQCYRYTTRQYKYLINQHFMKSVTFSVTGDTALF